MKDDFELQADPRRTLNEDRIAIPHDPEIVKMVSKFCVHFYWKRTDSNDFDSVSPDDQLVYIGEIYDALVEDTIKRLRVTSKAHPGGPDF